MLIPLRNCLLTALAYWLLGHVAGFFALPPGFASPIWPAAGIAFLMVLRLGMWSLLGVFIASFVLNMGFAGASYTEWSSAWLVSAVIGLGAVAQTWLAVTLVRRWAWRPAGEQTSHLASSVKLALLAGPVACLTSATIGTTTLTAFGLISFGQMPLNWLFWWVGDTIGVLAVAPLVAAMLLLRSWSSRLQALGFVGFYLVLVLVETMFFAQTREAERNQTEKVFTEYAEGAHRTITKQLDAIQNASQNLVALFVTFDDVSYAQFQRYSRGIFEYIPGAQAFSWIPVVPHTQREQYEQRMADVLGEPYVFEELSTGALVPAAPRPVYYPVYYIYPLEDNRRAAGFDLGSHPGRLAAIDQALTTDESVATEPLTLVQETGNQKAILLLTPIREDFRTDGLISSVYRATDLLEAALSERLLSEVAITVEDVTGPEPMLFYDNQLPGSDLVVAEQLDFAGRQWRITYTATASYVRDHQGINAWVVLVAGFLVVTVVGLFILQLMDRNDIVAREVQRKTAALRRALDEAREASEVKTNFLASMSHELRTPLNSIIGFSVRSLRLADIDSLPRVKDSFKVIERNGRHLLSLINDVLDLSKVEAGKVELERELMNVDQVTAEVLDSLQTQVEAKGLVLGANVSPIEELYVDPQRFKQILINLLSNAIKFTASGSVTVNYLLKEGTDSRIGLELQVSDTGPGIAPEDQSKVFRRFEQLGSSNSVGATPGSGLGLALVYELVLLHGGEVGLVSTPGEGSRFWAWFPLVSE